MDAKSRIDQLLKEYLDGGANVPKPEAETSPVSPESAQEAAGEQEALQNPPAQVETGGLIWPTGHIPRLAPGQVTVIKDYLRRQKGAPIDSIALICRRENCLYKQSCVLYQIDPQLTPIDRPCPIELTLLQSMMDDFSRQLEITEDNVIDLAILKEFVMWQIYAKRAREELAMDPQIVRKEFVGADSRGNVLTRENMHPAFIMLDKQSRTKQKLLESLLATREAKSKAATASIPTFASFLKSVMERAEEKTRLKEAGAQMPPTIEHKLLTEPEDLEE